jgi:hypothetical protein
MSGRRNSNYYIDLLSHILLGTSQEAGLKNAGGAAAESAALSISQMAGDFSEPDQSELWALANSHHVIVRALPALQRWMLAVGNGKSARWAADALEKEKTRISHALSFLDRICQALDRAGKVIVIKSLDHWPDLGSDLDLYTSADSAAVVAIMKDHFRAQVGERSWGDRLANKWNFVVPGLAELVEVHVGRLGQTGEQIAITDSLLKRSGDVQAGSYSFRVPAPEDRIMISTLQRMYRHFYFRLCDIVDSAGLMESGEIDYVYLRSLSRPAGLWEGVATYLAIVSGYVQQYRGKGFSLPSFVSSAARFGSDELHFRKNFLRIPIFPHSAKLYAAEWARLLLNGEFQNTLRLSLLPGLATAATLEMKFTGSDKGIW